MIIYHDNIVYDNCQYCSTLTHAHTAKMLKMEEELSRLRQEVVLQEQQRSLPPSRLAATPSRPAAGKGRTAHHSSTGGTCIHYIIMISQYNDITMTSHVGWHYRTGEHFLLPHTSSCFHHRQVIRKCPPAEKRKRKEEFGNTFSSPGQRDSSWHRCPEETG